MTFRQGLRDGLKPPFAGFVIVALIVGLVIILMEGAIRRNQHLDVSDAWFQRANATNMDHHLSKKIYQFRTQTESASRELAVVVLGASSTREALPADWERAGKDLEKRLGRPVRFINLSGTRLFPIDFLMLYESLGCQSDAIILVATSSIKLLSMSDPFIERSAQRSRFLVTYPTPHYDRIVTSHGFQVHHVLKLMQLRAALKLLAVPKLVEFLYHGELLSHGTRPLRYEEMEHWSADEFTRDRYDEWYAENYVDLNHAPDISLEALSALVSLTRARQQRLVLIEDPLHSSVKELLPDMDERYRQQLQQFVNEHGVPYYNVQQIAGVTDEAFHDFTHIVSQRDRYWEGFAQVVERVAGGS